MTRRSWISQRIIDRYGSKRGLLATTQYYWQNAFSRKYQRYAKIPHRVERVVFVCKGNICRSALAEYAFRQISSISTISFGLETHSGKGGNSRITRYALDAGIDMSKHKTTAMDHFKPRPDDLFVCMEPMHADILEKVYGSRQVVLLGHFGNPKKLYIHDPYSSTDYYAKRCTKYIIEATNNLSKVIPTTVTGVLP